MFGRTSNLGPFERAMRGYIEVIRGYMVIGLPKIGMNQMEKNTENDMEAGIIWWLMRFRVNRNRGTILGSL